MRVEAITRRADLPGLAERWDELAQSDTRDGFFRTSGWCRAWMEHVRPEAEPFVVVAKDSGGRIVGLAPLCRVPYNDLGFRLTGLSLAGREVVSGDFLDFVTDPALREESVRAILGFLRDKRSQWSLLVMGELVEDGESSMAVEALAREIGLPLRFQEQRICPYIALPETFDKYLSSLSSSFRYTIRRRLRTVESKGATVDVYSQPEEIVSRLDTMIALHLARWRRDNLPGTFGRRGFAAFLRQICSEPPAGSSCCLFTLNHEGTTVASLLAFHFGNTALYYQAGWDPDSALAAHSPGAVLMARSIRHAIEQGLTHYEFLRGDEAYKSHWTKSFRKTTTLLIGRSLAARGYLRVADLKDLVKLRLGRGAPTTSGSSATPEVTEEPEKLVMAGAHAEARAAGGKAIPE